MRLCGIEVTATKIIPKLSVKINGEKERTGLSYSQIAEKYGIAPAALLGWVKGKHSPSRASYRKYIAGNPLFYESLYV